MPNGTDLGRRFREAVVNAIERLEEFPQIGRPNARWRRVQVAGFPYDLVYRVKGDALEVLALAHHRRRPGYWKARAR
jgi:toxin ParE1/3/4